MILALVFFGLAEQHNPHPDLTEVHLIDLHQMKLSCASFFPAPWSYYPLNPKKRLEKTIENRKDNIPDLHLWRFLVQAAEQDLQTQD